jgi:SAM-dependent methyltransferase
VFRCPNCRQALAAAKPSPGDPCPHCGAVVEGADGVPLLVRDRAAIDRAIEEAKAAGLSGWYEAPQAEQWQGVWRHALLKRRAYVEDVIRRYRQAVPGPKRGVDLGCGDGEHMRFLAGHFDELYGSDYNVTRLKRAARVEGVDYVFMADVTDYPVDDESFDVVYFNHVLEHIPDDRRALAEVHRIVRPGGIVVLGTPNEGAAFWRMAYRFQPEFREASDHVQFYTAESLRERCLYAGFEILHEKPIGWGVPHWTLDSMIRGHRVVDDALEAVGRRFLRSQATSLYLILRLPERPRASASAGRAAATA